MKTDRERVLSGETITRTARYAGSFLHAFLSADGGQDAPYVVKVRNGSGELVSKRRWDSLEDAFEDYRTVEPTALRR